MNQTISCMKSSLLGFATLSLFSLHAFAATSTMETKSVAIKAAHLLDVAQGSMLDDAVVIVKGERIVQFGSKLSIPAGMQVIDLGNKTLLPGLIDAHTHLTSDPENSGYSAIANSVPRQTLTGAKNARLTLAAGFTTVRNLGADAYTDIGLRDAINAGDVPGPRIVASGPALGITGGHCDETMHAPEYKLNAEGVADGVAETAKKTRQVIKYGADVIKVCATGGVLSFGDDPRTAQYTFEELKSIVSEAHRFGRKVAAHAHGGDGIKLAILAGVDSIEHGSYIDDDIIALMKQHKTFLVPTLYLGDWLIDNAQAIKLPLPLLEKAKIVLPTARQNLIKAFKQGVKVAFGTDAAVYPHGLNAREFAVYVKMGMTPLAAIQSATTSAAELLGWSDRIGLIAPGKFADMIAVDGNPLSDITELERVKWVMKGGQEVRN